MSNKKQVKIYGGLLYPLEIGKPAIIQELQRIRRTSTVEHFITTPSGVVYIETQNTHYVLYPLAGAPSKEA